MRTFWGTRKFLNINIQPLESKNAEFLTKIVTSSGTKMKSNITAFNIFCGTEVASSCSNVDFDCEDIL